MSGVKIYQKWFAKQYQKRERLWSRVVSVESKNSKKINFRKISADNSR